MCLLNNRNTHALGLALPRSLLVFLPGMPFIFQKLLGEGKEKKREQIPLSLVVNHVDFKNVATI